jgi:hypothetical protein
MIFTANAKKFKFTQKALLWISYFLRPWQDSNPDRLPFRRTQAHELTPKFDEDIFKNFS